MSGPEKRESELAVGGVHGDAAVVEEACAGVSSRWAVRSACSGARDDVCVGGGELGRRGCCGCGGRQGLERREVGEVDVTRCAPHAAAGGEGVKLQRSGVHARCTVSRMLSAASVRLISCMAVGECVEDVVNACAKLRCASRACASRMVVEDGGHVERSDEEVSMMAAAAGGGARRDRKGMEVERVCGGCCKSCPRPVGVREAEVRVEGVRVARGASLIVVEDGGHAERPMMVTAAGGGARRDGKGIGVERGRGGCCDSCRRPVGAREAEVHVEGVRVVRGDRRREEQAVVGVDWLYKSMPTCER